MHICDTFSFNSKKIKLNSKDEDTIIIIETLFCDIEKNESILNRYYSYLEMQIKMYLKWGAGSQINWVIHISEDKIKYINALSELKQNCSNLFINVYEHSNKYEVGRKIDLNVKPNLFGDRYKNIFNKFIENSCIDFSNKFVVRIGLDDDDFISRDHILKVNLAVNKYKFLARNDEIYIGFLDVNIVYYSIDGSSKMDSVVMTKCMTGNRFSLAYSEIPKSPFSVTEDFIGKIDEGTSQYYLYESENPTFFYNRHGVNLSKNDKKIYYVKLIERRSFDDKQGLIDYIVF